MRKDGQGHLYFVVDTESDPTKLSHVGDRYETKDKALLDVFERPFKTHVSKDFIVDPWGRWLIGCSPILFPDGRVEASLCMDVSADLI
ncbi:MAG: hypothetical protein WC889_08860, partial [Myxococcota bacterium]